MNDRNTPAPRPETPDEWTRQAEAEPYRVAYQVQRRRWYVYDVRSDVQIGQSVRSQAEAVAKANKLNIPPSRAT